MPLATAPGAAARTSVAVTFNGSAGKLPAARGLLLVEAELALGRSTNRAHVASTLLDVPVASQQIAGGRFAVAVPDSPVLRRAERLGHGNVNFLLVIASGSWSTVQGVPVPLSPAAAPGNPAGAATARSRMVAVPRFPAYQPVGARAGRAAAGGPAALASRREPCTWHRYGNENEKVTRIGEVHVADPRGMSDTYEYGTQADSSITIGFSETSPTGPWSTSGSLTVNNSMGASGGWTAGRSTVIYANGHIYYQRYRSNDAQLCFGRIWRNQADHAAGDAFPGTRRPPGIPYQGGCTHDPHGFGTVPAHTGFWNSDTSKAAGYGGIASAWGFSFGGSTGFTKYIKDTYRDHGSVKTYVCGSASMPGVPIIYNTR
jgi:hypothetical protein